MHSSKCKLIFSGKKCLPQPAGHCTKRLLVLLLQLAEDDDLRRLLLVVLPPRLAAVMSCDKAFKSGGKALLLLVLPFWRLVVGWLRKDDMT